MRRVVGRLLGWAATSQTRTKVISAACLGPVLYSGCWYSRRCRLTQACPSNSIKAALTWAGKAPSWLELNSCLSRLGPLTSGGCSSECARQKLQVSQPAEGMSSWSNRSEDMRGVVTLNLCRGAPFLSLALVHHFLSLFVLLFRKCLWWGLLLYETMHKGWVYGSNNNHSKVRSPLWHLEMSQPYYSDIYRVPLR